MAYRAVPCPRGAGRASRGGAPAGFGDGSGHRDLAAALLEGVVWGHDGGGVAGAVGGVAGSQPGVLSHPSAERAVHAGAVAGRALLASGH